MSAKKREEFTIITNSGWVKITRQLRAFVCSMCSFNFYAENYTQPFLHCPQCGRKVKQPDG